MLEANQLLQGLIQYAVLLFSLSVHESSHAWVAGRLGDPTARDRGRVTLNPIAHIDPVGTVIMPIIMIFTSAPLIGWAKPVPVDLRNLRDPRRDHLRIAAAGPLSNLCLAIGFLAALGIVVRVAPAARIILQDYLAGVAGPLSASGWLPVVLILLTGVFLNTVLAVFNLLPIAPLDGQAVLQGLVSPGLAQRLEEFSRYGFMLLFLLVFTGALRYLLDPVYAVLLILIRLIAS